MSDEQDELESDDEFPDDDDDFEEDESDDDICDDCGANLTQGDEHDFECEFYGEEFDGDDEDDES